MSRKRGGRYAGRGRETGRKRFFLNEQSGRGYKIKKKEWEEKSTKGRKSRQTAGGQRETDRNRDVGEGSHTLPLIPPVLCREEPQFPF